jgi:hypothetical protein
MTEAEVKLQARLVVIEYMIIHLQSSIYKLTGATPEIVEKLRERCLANVRSMTIPGIPAVWSDLLSSEVEQAIQSLLDDVAENVRTWRNPIGAA